MKLEYVANTKDNDKIIKDIMLSKLDISHRLLTKLKRENSIFLNNKLTFVHAKIKEGDIITISLDYEEDNSNIIAKEMPLDIVYEDDCYLIINKPAGIPVHPSILHYEDSLSSGIKFYFDKIGLKKKIRPVNRIDKDTSGLVVFAKNEYVQEALIRQMKNFTFYKEYIAIIEGHLSKKKGIINAPISRKEGSIIERCIDENGEKAITNYEVLEELNLSGSDISVVKCVLKTGRTHQIRVHLSYISHPLLGDDLYGGNLELINRQALHSYKISFIHPILNKKVSYEAQLPNDLKMFINI